MKNLLKPLSILTCLLSLTSCTLMKVSERTQNGYFSSTKYASTIKAEKIDLDEHKNILVVPRSDNEFVIGMVKNIKYFDQVITFTDLEKDIVKNNKQEEIGSIEGRVGLSNISKKYKKFFYITFYKPSDKKLQLKLINPETTDDLFIAEVNYDIVWSGVYDTNTYNPLFNEFIKYIENNSKTYKR